MSTQKCGHIWNIAINVYICMGFEAVLIVKYDNGWRHHTNGESQFKKENSELHRTCIIEGCKKYVETERVVKSESYEMSRSYTCDWVDCAYASLYEVMNIT